MSGSWYFNMLTGTSRWQPDDPERSMYELTVELTAHGRASIDAEKAAMEMLQGQYDIDQDWDVRINTRPHTASATGEVALWEAELHARRR